MVVVLEKGRYILYRFVFFVRGRVLVGLFWYMRIVLRLEVGEFDLVFY